MFPITNNHRSFNYQLFKNKNMHVDRKSVSVILPVYNGVDYIYNSIQSILNQSYTKFELIVINDGSTQDIDKIISSFKDKRIRYYKRENRGLGYTLNELVSLSNYELIIRMDADDLSDVDRIKILVDFMVSKPDIVLCGSQIKIFSEEGSIQHLRLPTEHSRILEDLLCMKFSICHPSIIFRKSLFNQVGGYPENAVGEDMEFFLKMSKLGSLANVDKILFHYRIHDSSINSSKGESLYLAYKKSIFEYKGHTFNQNLLDIIFAKKYKIQIIQYRKYLVSKITKDYTYQILYAFSLILVSPIKSLSYLTKTLNIKMKQC